MSFGSVFSRSSCCVSVNHAIAPVSCSEWTWKPPSRLNLNILLFLTHAVRPYKWPAGVSLSRRRIAMETLPPHAERGVEFWLWKPLCGSVVAEWALKTPTDALGSSVLRLLSGGRKACGGNGARRYDARWDLMHVPGVRGGARFVHVI